MATNSGPTEAQLAHQELIKQLDMHSIHKSFRSTTWRPNQRRNKNLKTIVGDISKREAATSSMAATPANESGAATPSAVDNGGLSTSGTSTPAGSGSSSLQPNLAQASRSLSKLVLEKSLRPNVNGASSSTPAASGILPVVAGNGPMATYTNIESAPSLACGRHYCDVTGLPAPYLDPKTRLRYHNKEVFALIRNLPQATHEQFLEARGAHTVLK
ncbi:hypothetical protein MKZ38_006569 [Zalerion maritima]|uniref:Vps72/YL1 C-terminal domain-containing protein n=1 Tax=Zalerion maritima TaxID=339359 RepID=A0AAD5WNF1_9PEZI|nr:hypothetical protein MKZ38_006569 [Zalerion maritima]